MAICGLQYALRLARNGWRVIFVTSHHSELQPLIADCKDALAGESGVRVYAANGERRVAFDAGGIVRFYSPGESRLALRGVSADAVFAPPSLWAHEDFESNAAATLATADPALTLGGPMRFSTCERIAG